MASFKEKLDKNGNRIYEVQASNGRGRRVWRTFRPEPTWSKRTIERELQKFAAELEQQLADGEVLTREETAQKAAAEAVEAAKIKTFRGNIPKPSICLRKPPRWRKRPGPVIPSCWSSMSFRLWAMCCCRRSPRP